SLPMRQACASRLGIGVAPWARNGSPPWSGAALRIFGSWLRCGRRKRIGGHGDRGTTTSARRAGGAAAVRRSVVRPVQPSHRVPYTGPYRGCADRVQRRGGRQRGSSARRLETTRTRSAEGEATKLLTRPVRSWHSAGSGQLEDERADPIEVFAPELNAVA